MAGTAARWSATGLLVALAIPAVLALWMHLRRDADVAARAVTVPARVVWVDPGAGGARDGEGASAEVSFRYLGQLREARIDGRFTVGQRVEVEVDPLDPGRVWEAGTGPMTEEKAAAATVAVVVGGALFAVGWRARMRRHRGLPPW